MKSEEQTNEIISFTEKVVKSYGSANDSLISILQDIQAKYKYLPEPAIKQTARNLGLPLVQIYGVATFFKAFSLEPKGEHIINVCTGTACHVRGAHSVLDEFERRLDIKCGETTKDLQFSLETVNCVGACALGPVSVISDKYHGRMKAGKVKKMLAEYKKSSKD